MHILAVSGCDSLKLLLSETGKNFCRSPSEDDQPSSAKLILTAPGKSS
jgi:hypothetical protein